MHYHSQNLNECTCGKPFGYKLWRGRAWLHCGEPYKSRTIHWEWGFGKHARGFSVQLWFGNGDDDAGILFGVTLPWLLMFYIGISGIFRCKECHTGIAIHNGAFWVYPLPYTMETKREDPWWRHCHAFNFPWTLDWWKTDILDCREHIAELAPVVWSERKGKRKPFFDSHDERSAKEESVSETHDYTYVLKNGTIQKRKATIYVDRMEWRARWWPLIPIRKVRNSINVKFDQEVGERKGSWKGGVTGCGYELLPGETPLECLRRMERERKFT